MRNSMFLLVALASLAIFALPAAAGSEEVSRGAPSPVVSSGPIDLEAIPVQVPTGQKAIKGVGDDDDGGDSHNLGKNASHGSPLSTEAMDDASQDDDD